MKRIVSLLICCIISVIITLGCSSEVASTNRNINTSDDIDVVSNEPNDFFSKMNVGSFTIYVISDDAKAVDDEISPYNGYYEGHYKICVYKDERIIDEESVRFSDESVLYFPRSFELSPCDYNGDGNTDFVIGTYLSSNYDMYKIYSVNDVGELTELINDEGTEVEFQANRIGVSPAFKSDKNTITYELYDQEKGVDVTKEIILK